VSTSAQRLSLLAEAGRVLSESLDYRATFQSLARLVVPQLADYCFLFELHPQGTLPVVAVAHVDPAREPLLARVGELYRVLSTNPASLIGRAVRTGEPVLVPQSSLALAQAISDDPELLEIYQKLDPKSVLVLPLAARGQLLGALSLATTVESGRTYSEEDIRFARELAQRAALAIDNARLFGAAEAANQAKDHFLAVLSHELRTPLTPALMTLGRLLDSPDLSDDLRAQIDRVRRNVELESKLLDDLLDLTQLSRGKLELRREITDLHPLVQHAVDVFCASQIRKKQLACTAELTAAQHHVWGDPVRLQQIFWNLLQNAVKFTPDGGRIETRTWNDPAGAIQISIADTGMGIEPEALPRLFDAFEQAEASVHRRFGGLGLGLAVCKSLVELHGGSIEAKSEGKGRGTVFTVTLPTSPAPDRAVHAALPAEVRPTRPLRILLVEDHEDTLLVMANFLETAHHQVQSARDVTSALELAGRHEFDLVVSDLGLPDGSGLDLMRTLRERHGLKGVAVSGYGTAEDVAQSLAAGFVEHLTKPVYPAKLKEAIIRAAGWPPSERREGAVGDPLAPPQ
jgi:signal transduction histidine kinase/CheY-like chemotaxis protein